MASSTGTLDRMAEVREGCWDLSCCTVDIPCCFLTGAYYYVCAFLTGLSMPCPAHEHCMRSAAQHALHQVSSKRYTDL